MFVIISRWILKMSDVTHKSWSENQTTHFIFSNFFSKIMSFICMWSLLLFHSNNGYANAAQYYVYTYIAWLVIFSYIIGYLCRFQWPRGLRRRSAAARLLRSWVRIPPEAWIYVCCDCCVLSGRGLCDELITRPEESYRQWCVVVCDLENPHEWGGHRPHWAAAPQEKK